MSGAAFGSIGKLSASDTVDAFDCGHPALNQFLQRYILANQKANSAQTYVCCNNGEVVGFYSLAVGSVDPESEPSRVSKGLARHPVSVMVLARLAVDQTHQRKGLGQALLKDALLRTAQAADMLVSAPCWFTPGMRRRVSGTNLGSLNRVRRIHSICS